MLKRLSVWVVGLLAVVGGTPVQAGKIYWTDGYEIKRANLDGSGVETIVPSTSFPEGITIDLSANAVYWLEGVGIRRANLDGSNKTILLNTGLTYPHGIAIDRRAGKIYWNGIRPDGAGAIRRADLDGSNVETVIRTPGSHPWGLGLDPAEQSIYWSDTTERTIRRVDMDGSNIVLLVDGLSSVTAFPTGIDLDLAGGHVYWSTFSLGGSGDIRRANLDGTNRTQLVRKLGGVPDVAIDPVGGKIYWPDLEWHRIQRADLDGSNLEDLVVTGSYPRGVDLAIAGVCGDGVLDTFEECDDANGVGGDGCTPDCTASHCGDGFPDPGEPCDDGNFLSCDGCLTDCTMEPGIVCGDGIPNDACNELCDDGNVVDGDGCDSNCLTTACGNGVVTDGEECDDGNVVNCDGCSKHCLLETGFCGDGVADTPCEQCDAGGMAYFCDGDCTFVVCGDDYTNPAAGEQCDDGNKLDGDGCQADCTPTRAILYDQLDFPSGGGRATQDFESYYVLYDCEAADDFIIEFSEAWDVDNVFVPGFSQGEMIHVNLRFYPDSGGFPDDGSPECSFFGITDFKEKDGDLSIELPEPCRLGPGHWWFSLQARMDVGCCGQYFWGTRKKRTARGGVWRNPGDGFHLGCIEWTPQVVCGGGYPDYLFRLLGRDDDDPDLPPASGASGALPLAFSLGGGAAYVLGRRRRGP